MFFLTNYPRGFCEEQSSFSASFVVFSGAKQQTRVDNLLPLQQHTQAQCMGMGMGYTFSGVLYVRGFFLIECKNICFSKISLCVWTRPLNLSPCTAVCVPTALLCQTDTVYIAVLKYIIFFPLFRSIMAS